MDYACVEGGPPAGRPNARPPSVVLCIKCFEFTEAEMKAALSPFGGGSDIPTFLQDNKGLLFAQFPSLQHSSSALEYLNRGNLESPSGRNVTAEYSSRTEVTTTRKRPGDALEDRGSPPGYPSKKAPTPMGSGGGVQASPVLCIKTDLSEEHLLTALHALSATPMDMLHIASKNIAFVQYSSVAEAHAILAQIRQHHHVSSSGFRMEAMFSTRQSIERNETKTPRSDAYGPGPYADAAAGAYADLDAGAYAGGAYAGAPYAGVPGAFGGREGPVVVVTLRQRLTAAPAAVQPISVDILLAPLARCGLVERLAVEPVIPPVSASVCEYEAIVQYASPEYARLCKQRYEGQCLGEYMVTVRYGDRSLAPFVRNSDMCRDFINPWLPEEQRGTP